VEAVGFETCRSVLLETRRRDVLANQSEWHRQRTTILAWIAGSNKRRREETLTTSPAKFPASRSLIRV
jgi:hypothetical protein